MNKNPKKRTIDDEVFICLDCESTGLDPEKDRIIEVAAVKFTLNQTIDQIESLIDPGCSIPEESIKVHNITEEMVKGKPTAKEFLPKLFDFVGDHVIVGHSIDFDIGLLYHTAMRKGIETSIRSNPLIDTVRLARHYGESPSNKLETLRKHFNIEDEGAHRAMSDVLVNIEVFRFLSKFYSSTEEILAVLKKPILLKYMPLGPHKGRLMKEVPIEFLRWGARKKFDQDLLYTMRVELKRRKDGKKFGQASNPFLDFEL